MWPCPVNLYSALPPSPPLSKVSSGITYSRKLSLRLSPRSLGWLLLLWVPSVRDASPALPISRWVVTGPLVVCLPS